MAAGTGITLTRGNVFVFGYVVESRDRQQSYDRVHRLGQTRPVRIIRLITEDSLEQRMVSLQENKSALDNGFMCKLSAEERKKVFCFCTCIACTFHFLFLTQCSVSSLGSHNRLKDLFEVVDIEQHWDVVEEDESEDLGGFIGEG